MPTEIIKPKSTEEWLELRKAMIGASEAKDAVEQSTALWERKLGLVEPPEMTPPMKWGLRHEANILDAYSQETGNWLEDRQRFLVNRDDYGCPLGATLDGWTQAGYPVEAKSVSQWRSREIGDDDDLPLAWLFQAHQQMLLSDTSRVDFAILVGSSDFRIRPVVRSDELIDLMMLPGLKKFWDHVTAKMPPDPLALSIEAVTKLYPINGEAFEADDELANRIARYEEIGQQVKSLEEAREHDKRAIIAMLKGRTALMPTGQTAKLIQVAGGKLIPARVSTGYVKLQISKRKGE